MKNFKKQNGITLVALVVTIIVLLILAGVSLSLVAGENGILKRATSAVDKNEIGTAKEQAGLLINNLMTEYYEEKYVNHDETVAAQTPRAFLAEKTGGAAKGSENSDNGKYWITITNPDTGDGIITVGGGALTANKGTETTITGKVTTEGTVTWDEPAGS